MARGLAIVAVMVGGWAIAVSLALVALRNMGFLSDAPPISGICAVACLILTPATPAVAAWLAAQAGWTVAAWILGGVAAVLAAVLGWWAIGMWTQS
jgi:hypothetical protein